MAIWAIIIALIFTLIFLFSAYPHLLNILRCGKPKPFGFYKCFDYKTLKALNPIALEKDKSYNKFVIPDSIASQLKQYNTLAFLVIQNNQLLFERYFGIDSATRINSFSAAKTVTSLLAGIAIDQGYIKGIDQKVADFFPQFGDSLTIRHLLTMSSGLDWNESFINPFSDVIQAFYTNDLKPLLARVKPKFTPGQVWSYQCVNTLILGQIVEKATGEKLDKFAQDNLWMPLGAESDAYWTCDQNDIIKSFCCFYATARDYARLGLLILNGGRYNGIQIVSKTYIDQMLTVAGLSTAKGKSVKYGLHIWLLEYKGMQIPHLRGMYGQFVFIIPQKNAVIVRLGNKRVEEIDFVPQDTWLYLDLGFDILHN